MITDAGITVGVGPISTEAQRLLGGTQKALRAGLNVIRAGCHVGDISAAVERVLRAHKLGIVHELVGHGVGHDLHEDPNIPNLGKAGRGPVLKAGMTVAIEPIANLGRGDIIVDPDGWTIWTADGSLSAQFEHTVLITQKGSEILTQV
jgi:methionyl aminopeptidase